MNNNLKTACGKTVKIAGGLCAATGVMALSAVVASGAALGAVVEGFKAARKTMSEIVEKEFSIRKEEVCGEVPVQTEQKAEKEIMEESEIELETQEKAE